MHAHVKLLEGWQLVIINLQALFRHSIGIKTCRPVYKIGSRLHAVYSTRMFFFLLIRSVYVSVGNHFQCTGRIRENVDRERFAPSNTTPLNFLAQDLLTQV